MNEPGARGPHALRLFFALWPSAAERQSLAASTADAVSQVDGLPIPGTNLHVTLAFLGSVPGRRLGDLADIGGQGGYPAVALRFDCFEYWAKPRVLVAMPVEIPVAGREIVDRLWERLAPLGFERESRAWRPHLTLARKVRRPPPENLRMTPRSGASEDPEPWGLALVESTSHPEGARYRPLAEWLLSR